MPEMKSPDGTETLTVSKDGAAVLKALGWTTTGGSGSAARPADPEGGETPKRRPGRPPKARED